MDVSDKMREAAREALAMHGEGLGLMPDDPGLMSACLAWVRRGAMTQIKGMRNQETGREGVGFKVDPAWIPRLEALAERRFS